MPVRRLLVRVDIRLVRRDPVAEPDVKLVPLTVDTAADVDRVEAVRTDAVGEGAVAASVPHVLQ